MRPPRPALLAPLALLLLAPLVHPQGTATEVQQPEGKIGPVADSDKITPEEVNQYRPTDRKTGFSRGGQGNIVIDPNIPVTPVIVDVPELRRRAGFGPISQNSADDSVAVPN